MPLTSSDGREKGEPILIDLALQGGGSHGAFTWGVLERLLNPRERPGMPRSAAEIPNRLNEVSFNATLRIGAVVWFECALPV